MPIILSDHAVKRCSQRGIRSKDILFALNHGTLIRKAGALFIFVRKKDLPEGQQQHEGLTLVLSPKGKILKTTYRNRKAIKNIKRKKKSRRSLYEKHIDYFNRP